MIKQFISFIFVALSVSLTSVQANDASEAMKQIQRMSDAMHNKSYSGEFVYVHSDQLESMSIQHVRTDKGFKERLFSLNGEAREVFRDEENLTCVWPGSKKLIKDATKKSSFSPLWIPDDVKRLAKFYHFKIVGMDRVANRIGKIIAISPKDKLRYGMKIWVDESEGYLLKSSLINEKNKVLEQVMFTGIHTVKSPDLLGITLTPKNVDDYSVVSSHVSSQENRMPVDTAWRLEKMPKGFWLESAYKKPVKDNNEYIHHMVFTDGLSSLSLFIEKQTDDSLMGSSSMGAVNAYGVIINNHSVTAVGEVPQKTVKQLVMSIYYE